MYENKSEPLASGKTFGTRLFVHIFIALAVVFVTLLIGITGHVYFDDMQLGTALIASITLISGLGLSVLPESTSGQLFASIYGVLSGYVYIATSSIVFAPIVHRVFHKFHLDDE